MWWWCDGLGWEKRRGERKVRKCWFRARRFFYFFAKKKHCLSQPNKPGVSKAPWSSEHRIVDASVRHKPPKVRGMFIESCIFSVLLGKKLIKRPGNYGHISQVLLESTGEGGRSFIYPDGEGHLQGQQQASQADNPSNSLIERRHFCS